jgi:ABC-type multidrug transport system fused ATPase/permease subunit
MRSRLEESDDLGGTEVLRLIGRALRYIRPFRREYAIKLALLLASFVPMLLLPWPTKILIDQVIRGVPFGEQPTPFPFFVRPFVDAVAGLPTSALLFWTIAAQFVLLVLIGAFGINSRERSATTDSGIPQGWDMATRSENDANSGFSLVGGVFGLIDYRFTMRLSQKLNHHYRTRLFDRIQSLPMSSLDDERIGDAVYRIMVDTTAITQTCYRLTLTPIAAPLYILLTVWVMGLVYGWQSPIVFAALGFLPVALLPTLPFVGLSRRLSATSRRAGATTTSSLEESMSNVLVVQSLGGETRERRRFDTDSEDSFRQYRLKIFAEILAFFAAAVVGAGLVILVLVHIGDAIIDGHLSAGDFAVLLSFFVSIAAASGDLGSLWIRLQSEATGLNRVFFLMDADSEADANPATALPLVGELPGRQQHDRLGLRQRRVDRFDEGDAEGTGLAAARLGADDQIPAGSHAGDRGGLDGGRGVPAEVADRALDVGGDFGEELG